MWELEEFLVEHPPADWLIAAYLGYKAPGSKVRNIREAAQANSSVLGDMGKSGVKLQRKNLLQMPAYLRSPEKLAMIEKMKAEWQTK